MEQAEAIRRIEQAKAVIDNGLCRVGPRLSAASAVEGLLAGGSSRVIALSGAVVQLCRHDHPTEALPILRQLVETAAGMAWAVRRGEDAARELLGEARAGSWDSIWRSARARARAGEAGLPLADFDAVEAAAAEFLLGGRCVAPWSHLFPENARPGAQTVVVLERAVRWMGHALRALDERWPGTFPGEPWEG